MVKKVIPMNEVKDDNSGVLEDILFKRAIAFAKAIAKNISIESLRPDVVLCGFQFALADKKISDSYPKILAKLDAISASVKASGLTVPDHIKMIEGEKFPSSVELKTILAAKEIGLEELIDQLISANLASPSLDSPEYTEILLYAASLAKKLAQTEIMPEVFSTAAYLAFLHGRFITNQAISLHFLGSHAAYDMLRVDLGINEDWLPEDRNDTFKLNEALKGALNSEGSKETRLFATLNLGLIKGRELIDRIATAYHEAGHAVVSLILRPTLSVNEISIVPDPKNGSLGVTSYDINATFDRSTKESYLAGACTMLAGRAAQLIKFGPSKIDWGASSDLQMATETIWDYVTEQGLDDDFGMISLKKLQELQDNASGWLFDKAQQRLHAIVNQEARRAENILRENWDKVEIITQDLLAKKVIAETSISNDMISTGLTGVKGSLSAKSIPVEHPFVIARHPGIIRTPEGPVRYEAGDAISNYETGLNWAISKSYFEKYYEPSDGYKFGTDGIYQKKPQTVLVFELQQTRRLDFRDGRGVLFGEKGDWMVDYGNGELSIVRKDQFTNLYELD